MISLLVFGRGLTVGQYSEETVRVLINHRRRQCVRRASLGNQYEDNNLVFAGADGRAMAPYILSPRFARLVKKAGLAPLRFHDLRHTCATLLLLASVHPKVVSERLGHAGVAITLDTYSHVVPGLQNEAASLLDKYLKPPAPPTPSAIRGQNRVSKLLAIAKHP